MTYNEIVAEWKEKVQTTDIFTGRLLYGISSEFSKVENIQITYNQTKELFDNEYIKNYTGDLRDLYSVVNNRELAKFYNNELKKGSKITPWFIKESHRILMRAAIDNRRYHENHERAGEYKLHDYGVGKFDVGSVPEDVPEDIRALCDLVDNGEVGVDIRASIFHCVFESIHPFADGNGRVGRWLMNYLLVSGKHPPIVTIDENKQEYYDALEDYDTTGKVTKFREFLHKQTVASYPVYRYLVNPRLEKEIQEKWELLPPSLTRNFTGDKYELLRDFKLID